MFDLGIQELIVIFIVALLVFGPKRLPELGRTLGKGIAELKKAMQGVKEQMDAEMDEIKAPLTLADPLYRQERKEQEKAQDETRQTGATEPAEETPAETSSATTKEKEEQKG
ncbi:MAG: twin-arginine translocase TatA/TatE family subunit [Alphaproteobacteria bacterium]|uniref:Sec-independent protein translocase protein TatA n=1 Tax=Candidatus Nitrobium versatile TaxID=2884831 RepID=A0A953SG54_9BACT|nr:twin-arginine translocase TatA/TatE family subunit [Candidatus Nitrobium versatile]